MSFRIAEYTGLTAALLQQRCHSKSSKRSKGWRTTPMGLITCVLIPRPAQQNQSGLPSTFPLQSHGEGLWWDTAGMASHRRLREAQAAAQPPNPAHSNSHDWSWSSAELPGQALSKGQVTHPPLSLESPAAQHRWDNHRHPRLPRLCSSSPTGERRSNTASTACHRQRVTAWHFLRRNTAYATCTCYEGRATIL